MVKLIAFGGLKGSGKSLAADHLVQNRGWVRVKMAGALKQMLRTLLDYQGVSDEYIDWCVEGSLKEEVNPFLFMQTPRFAMQTLGTEWGRDTMGEGFWTQVALNRILKLFDTQEKVVVDDVRFPNELEMIKSLGGKTVWIDRKEAEVSNDTHPSETSVDSTMFDELIDNDDTIEEFIEKVNQLVNS